MAAACTWVDDDPMGGGAAAPLVLTGVYTYSIETIDGYSYCGGPVYTTGLEGAVAGIAAAFR